jgi:hypothetical protein
VASIAGQSGEGVRIWDAGEKRRSKHPEADRLGWIARFLGLSETRRVYRLDRRLELCHELPCGGSPWTDLQIV